MAKNTDKPTEGTGFTGKPDPTPRGLTRDERRATRKAADIRPGDVVTVPMTVTDVAIGVDSVTLTLVHAQGHSLTVRHTPGDGIAEVERPETPVIPFRGANFAGGTSRGPV